MDFEDTAEEAAFRSGVRAWLRDNAAEYAQPPAAPYSEEELVARGRAWQARKAAAGYAGIRWPKAIGGRGGTLIEAMIFEEEEARYHLPTGAFTNIGLSMAVPAILKHGTAEQLARFAGPTLQGQFTWCQLFSEPGAGSDLAALRTRAVRDGDRWIVNGQKVWSSWAHHADWAILLARTDPTVAKHKGLSLFLLDMRTPGIDVRPIRQISGKSDFNETFLTDVVIPDDCRIGAVGEGWACAMTVLMSERLASGGDDETGGIADLIELAARIPFGDRAAQDHGALRERLAHFYAQELAQKYFRLRLVTKVSRGAPLGAEAAIVKLAYASRLQQASGLAMEMQGYAGVVANPDDQRQLRIFEDYIWSTAMRVAGGADEVLKNQIAERVLGLPGEIRADKDVPFDKL